MVPAPVERSQLPGSSTTIAEFCSTDSGSALPLFAAPTRAREAAPIPARSDADRPGRRGGAAAAGRRRHFFLAELLFAASGADDGARAIGAAADVGFAWSGRRRWCRRRSSAASYRVIDNDRKFRSTDSGSALPLFAAPTRARDGANSSAL